jgi:hypothetical protein
MASAMLEVEESSLSQEKKSPHSVSPSPSPGLFSRPLAAVEPRAATMKTLVCFWLIDETY